MSETNQTAGTKTANRTARDVSILVVITLASGILLGAAYTVTKGPIAAAQEKARTQAQHVVMEEAKAFVPLEDSEALVQAVQTALDEKGLTATRVEQIDVAQDKVGKTTGYVVSCTNAEGYGGDVELMCGIAADKDGTLTIEGISFLSLTETAGMGMRAREDEFMSQFDGIQIREGESLVYTKNGASEENEIDAISGCTVTTSAVTKDINAALEAVRVILEDQGGAGSAAE